MTTLEGGGTESLTVEEAAQRVATPLNPALQSVVVPDREPSRVSQDGCFLEIHPDSDAGYIQHVDLSAVHFSDDGYVWYGAGDVGNAVLVLETTDVGRIRWRKPGQDSSPFPFAVIQTAKYVKKPLVEDLVAATKAAIARCSAT